MLPCVQLGVLVTSRKEFCKIRCHGPCRDVYVCSCAADWAQPKDDYAKIEGKSHMNGQSVPDRRFAAY